VGKRGIPRTSVPGFPQSPERFPLLLKTRTPPPVNPKESRRNGRARHSSPSRHRPRSFPPKPRRGRRRAPDRLRRSRSHRPPSRIPWTAPRHHRPSVPAASSAAFNAPDYRMAAPPPLEMIRERRGQLRRVPRPERLHHALRALGLRVHPAHRPYTSCVESGHARVHQHQRVSTHAGQRPEHFAASGRARVPCRERTARPSQPHSQLGQSLALPPQAPEALSPTASPRHRSSRLPARREGSASRVVSAPPCRRPRHLSACARPAHQVALIVAGRVHFVSSVDGVGRLHPSSGHRDHRLQHGGQLW